MYKQHASSTCKCNEFPCTTSILSLISIFAQFKVNLRKKSTNAYIKIPKRNPKSWFFLNTKFAKKKIYFQNDVNGKQDANNRTS